MCDSMWKGRYCQPQSCDATSLLLLMLSMWPLISLLRKALLFSGFLKTNYSEGSILHHVNGLQKFLWVLTSWQLFWDNLSKHFRMNKHIYFLRQIKLKHFSKVLVITCIHHPFILHCLWFVIIKIKDMNSTTTTTS